MPARILLPGIFQVLIETPESFFGIWVLGTRKVQKIAKSGMMAGDESG